MSTLISAAGLFAGIHLFVSGTALREKLVRVLGEQAYRGLFSLASLLSLVWLARSYSAAYASDNSLLWHLGVGPLHAAAPVMLTALLFAVPGLLTRGPTSVGQERLLERDPEGRGIHRVTRHPFLSGVTIWATFHLCANGDAASVVLFSTFLLVAVVGMRAIDRKRARALGEAWQRYAAVTSRVPFAAILRRRNRLVLREIGWWRFLAVLAAFAVIVSIHPWLFGAYPLPGMDD